jgi:hypothetical protein
MFPDLPRVCKCTRSAAPGWFCRKQKSDNMMFSAKLFVVERCVDNSRHVMEELVNVAAVSREYKDAARRSGCIDAWSQDGYDGAMHIVEAAARYIRLFRCSAAVN